MKRIWTRTILSFAALIVAVPAVHAQAVYAATESTRIQAGVGGLYLHNDYTDKAGQGLSIWVDYDFKNFRGFEIGVEAAAHFGGIITPDDIGENSYLIGPRVSYKKRRLDIYGKLLVGRATITNQLLNQSSSFNVLPAFGGGVDYRVSRKFNIRAVDFELQQWPDFEPHTLSPYAISVGVMYIIR